jgi:PadR family transcriptional regulator, regulatory protein PadR
LEGDYSMASTEQILRNLFLGFIRLHILHHAMNGPIFGAQIIEELTRHGYNMGPGTLYPILHELETKDLLQSTTKKVDGKRRKYYGTTSSGQLFLEKARRQAVELVKEISEV